MTVYFEERWEDDKCHYPNRRDLDQSPLASLNQAFLTFLWIKTSHFVAWYMQLKRYPRTSNRRNRYLACSSFILRARTQRSAGVLLLQFLTLVRIQSKKWSWIPIIVTVCPLSVTVSILNGNCLRVNVKHCSLRQYRKCSTRLSGFPTPIFQNCKFHHIY